MPDGRRVVPIEIKLGAAVDRHGVAGLRQCMNDLGLREGFVISSAREPRSIGAQIQVVPWADVVQRKVDFGLGAGSRTRRLRAR